MLGNCLQYLLYVHFFLLLIQQKDFLLKLQGTKKKSLTKRESEREREIRQEKHCMHNVAGSLHTFTAYTVITSELSIPY